jgi:hypothetical protein
MVFAKRGECYRTVQVVEMDVPTVQIRGTLLVLRKSLGQCHHQCIPSPFPSPPVIFFPSQKHLRRAKKKNSRPGGVKSEKSNVTLAYGLLRGGCEN